MIGKIIAGLMVTASDNAKETIKLTKQPGKKGSRELELNVRFKCERNRIPMYCEKIIVSAASATNVSFEEMIKHITTCHELMGEISEEKTATKKKEVSDEGQQDQQPDHDAGTRQQG